jgi:CHAT domain-containing protein
LSKRLPKFTALPGTAREAAAARPRLQKYTEKDPTLLLGRDATRQAVEGLQAPRVLLLSTHGFFLPDVPRPSPLSDFLRRERPTLDRPVNPLENPLLRCGLALAGANRREDGLTGVLMGLDVLRLELRGCELVALSACETGLGQLCGEGVSGLRQAFQLAGARSVLASLWQVPDNDTALLMQSFFERLAQGDGHAEALRQSQLARIEAHRKKDGVAHPFFWAAFSLTGTDTPRNPNP